MAIRWYSAERLTKLMGEPYTEGQWIDLANLPPPGPSIAPYVVRDVDPYRSIVTREMVGGRAQHREHLKRHDLVEIGTERMAPRKPIEPTSEEIVNDIKRAMVQGPSPEQRAHLARAQKALS